MFFDKIYNNYYLAINKMLQLSQDGKLNDKTKKKVIGQYGYNDGQSMMQLDKILKSFNLSDEDNQLGPVKRPLTTLEKEWLMAVKNDEKMQLFYHDIPDFEGIEPLYKANDVQTLDINNDGDDYSMELCQNFHIIMEAIGASNNLTVKYKNSHGCTVEKNIKPKHLEFSEKDDKFRLIGEGEGKRQFINLGRILSCEFYDGEVLLCSKEDKETSNKRAVKIHLENENNALERVMLQFAHCKNKIVDLDEKNYEIEIEYDITDEIEMVIKILSFEDKITVIEPMEFIDKIRERLIKQKEFTI